ncbi:MAG: hypothetical protein ACYDGR_16565 [Candidatus Dormibacteria bacterium]
MRSILWFLLGVMVALSGQAFAEYVDPYGNSLDYRRGYTIPRGGYGYRLPDGTIAYPPIMPSPLQPHNPC